jgi:hypothetical protein
MTIAGFTHPHLSLDFAMTPPEAVGPHAWVSGERPTPSL